MKVATQRDVIHVRRLKNGGEEVMKRKENGMKSEAEIERAQRIALLRSLTRIDPMKFVQILSPNANLADAAVAEVEEREKLREMLDKFLPYCIARD